jgi:hypothetical protein
MRIPKSVVGKEITVRPQISQAPGICAVVTAIQLPHIKMPSFFIFHTMQKGCHEGCRQVLILYETRSTTAGGAAVGLNTLHSDRGALVPCTVLHRIIISFGILAILPPSKKFLLPYPPDIVSCSGGNCNYNRGNDCQYCRCGPGGWYP